MLDGVNWDVFGLLVGTLRTGELTPICSVLVDEVTLMSPKASWMDASRWLWCVV